MTRRFLSHAAVLATALSVSGLSLFAGDSAPGLKATGSLSIEETYDSNVFLQSTSRLADQESWVTAISPVLSLAWVSRDASSMALTYSPSWTRFHSASSEDFIAHRLNAKGQTRFGAATFSAQGGISMIDGSDESIVWTGAGGAPATGGAAVRDRRDQIVYRATARVDWNTGSWLIRPNATLYAADFRTVHRSTPGYQNAVDRNDVSAGIDFMRKAGTAVSTGLGYRYGAQDQAQLLAYPEQYDNRYQRILAVLEGKPLSWLALAITAGPEFRSYGPHVHASFGDRDVTNLYVDGTATVVVSTRNSLTLAGRQFEQVGASGRGAFSDLNLDASWRHTVSKNLAIVATIHAYGTDFLKPAVRKDWILTQRISASLKLTEKWTLDCALTRDEGISRVPNTSGREFERAAFSTLLKRTF